jgi:hypothetical protein
VIVSGLHSPLEQQLLRSVRQPLGHAIKVLGHGMSDCRPPTDEIDTLAIGGTLVFTVCPHGLRHTTRATPPAQNQLVMALADETVVPHVTEGGLLAALVEIHNHE